MAEISALTEKLFKSTYPIAPPTKLFKFLLKK